MSQSTFDYQKWRSHNHGSTVLRSFFLQRFLQGDPANLHLTTKYRSHNYGSIVLHEFFLQRLTSNLLVDEPIYV